MDDNTMIASTTALSQRLDHYVRRRILMAAQAAASSPDSQSYHSHHYSSAGGNATITSTVVIRVTPKEDHLLSWGILWGCFVVASLVALWQSWREYQLMSARIRPVGAGAGGDGDRGEISTADITRSNFRRLLLVAMIWRVAMMPSQIWLQPLIWQFIGDSFPEVFFTAAWTLLVGFFVQVVGIATGAGVIVQVDDFPTGRMMLTTFLAVYAGVVVLQLRNSVASVLWYSLMCCIYLALMGVLVYFGPRLLVLLKPNSSSNSNGSLAADDQQNSGIATRLIICTVISVALFGAHVITFARRVLAPPHKVYWWWHYGVLELLPTVVFLAIMKPGSKTGSTNSSSNNNNNGYQRKSTMHRVDSTNSATSNNPQRSRSSESVGLLKSGYTYGSTAN